MLAGRKETKKKFRCSVCSEAQAKDNKISPTFFTSADKYLSECGFANDTANQQSPMLGIDTGLESQYGDVHILVAASIFEVSTKYDR